MQNIHSRRKFLAFAAASPLMAQQVLPRLDAPAGKYFTMTEPKHALAIRDLEEACSKKMATTHWAYLQTGIDDDYTLRANMSGFLKLVISPHRLLDAREADKKITIWGETFASPIYITAVAGHGSFHKDSESGVARACKAKNVAMMLSADTSTKIEQVVPQLGRPCWYQMYAPALWEGVEAMTKRVEAAGCTVMMLTVDNFGGRNTETQTRMARKETKKCEECHPGVKANNWDMVQGPYLPTKGTPYAFDWAFVDRLKKLTKMKLVLKGIVTREDAALSVAHGMDGIIVSNHGGRNTEEGRGSIECLPEVIEGARGQIPVFLDGGVRRGSDAFKALALGATMVGIGRAYIYGLGAFGQAGVERCIDILQGELDRTMCQSGCKNLQQINAGLVSRMRTFNG